MGLMVFAGHRRKNQAWRLCDSREGCVVHERVAEMRLRNYDEIKEFINDNKIFSIFVVGLFILCVIGECWILSRIISGTGNENGHLDTGVTMERLETGIESARDRVERIGSDVENIETSVNGAAAAIRESEAAAGKITDGIADCEKRVDSLKQGFGRIENLVADIETANRARTQGSPAQGVAK